MSALTPTQRDSLFSYLGSEGINDPVGRYIVIDRWGGGVSKRAPDATSFAQNDALLSSQICGGLLITDG
ncbi:hypothetical protein OPQ81_006645 [Rhizoctonia solani]|nr:hypothetical protein OPQ81_006645 [Rhizoctonia solani]